MPLRVRLGLFALGTAAWSPGRPSSCSCGRASTRPSTRGCGTSADVAASWRDGVGAGRPAGTPVQVLTADGRVSSSAGTAALLTDTQRRRPPLAGDVHSADGRTAPGAGRARAGAGARSSWRGARTVVSDVAVERVELALLVAAPMAVLLAGVGGWLLAGAALRPVERMRREAAAISERDLDRRLGVPRPETSSRHWPPRSTRCSTASRRPCATNGGSSPTPGTSCGRPGDPAGGARARAQTGPQSGGAPGGRPRGRPRDRPDDPPRRGPPPARPGRGRPPFLVCAAVHARPGARRGAPRGDPGRPGVTVAVHGRRSW